jgi:acyl-CoA thioesterase FadM
VHTRCRTIVCLDDIVVQVKFKINMKSHFRRKSFTGLELETAVIFLIRRQWTFSLKLYQRAAVDLPMTVKWTINNVGNTSFDGQYIYIYSLADKPNTGDSTRQASCPATTSDQFLASSVFRLVHVDAISRRPTPFPPQIEKDLRFCVSANGEKLTALRPPSTIPNGAFSCSVTVRYDDTDFNGHTNTASYIRFALECAAQAAESGFYSRIKGDIAFYPAKSANSIFMSDSEAGDELTVSTWEDAEDKMLFNFTVSKGGEMINFAQIQYFSLEETAGLLR